jgi:hypothetical protein
VRDQHWPPSVIDWVPEGHLVWTMLNAVGELDSSAFLPAIAWMGTSVWLTSRR